MNENAQAGDDWLNVALEDVQRVNATPMYDLTAEKDADLHVKFAIAYYLKSIAHALEGNGNA